MPSHELDDSLRLLLRHEVDIDVGVRNGGDHRGPRPQIPGAHTRDVHRRRVEEALGQFAVVESRQVRTPAAHSDVRAGR